MELTFIPFFFITLSAIIYFIKPNLFEYSKVFPLWGILVLKIILLTFITGLVGWPYDAQGYFDHAKLIWQGGMPFKNFNSPYSIGFEYLMAFVSFDYHSPLFIGISILLFEFVAYYLLLANKLLRKGLITNLAWNPLFFHFSIFDIQDEFIILFFVSWIILIFFKDISKFHLVYVSILFLFCTKILSLIFIAPIFYKHHKYGYMALVAIFTIFLTLYFLGFRIFAFEFDQHNGSHDLIWNMNSSGNFVWILKSLGYSTKSSYSMILTSVALGLINLFLAFNPCRRKFTSLEYFVKGCLLNILTLLLFYQMTFPYNYLVFLFVYTIAKENNILNISFFSGRILIIYLWIISLNHQAEYLLNIYHLKNSILFFIYFLIQMSVVLFNAILFYKIFRSIYTLNNSATLLNSMENIRESATDIIG